MTTASKMPLILGNAVPVDLADVDDLFGDAVGLSLQESRSQGRPSLQKMDDSRGLGCCQTVSWSRCGTIASITPDGQSLEFRFLRCSPHNGSWDLGDSTTCTLVSGSPGIPLVHLEWGPTNTQELAVFDSLGRVTIISFPISLNSPYMTRRWDADALDDANAVVGAHWLAIGSGGPHRSHTATYGPATKNGYQYHYEKFFIPSSGPSHPHPAKSALCSVTISGAFKLLWSQNNNRLEETTIELESVLSAEELLTHAAMGPDQQNLLVVVATASRQLRLIKIDIQWGGPGSSPEKNPLPQNARLSPSIVETHLAATSWPQPTTHGDLGDLGNDASMAELSSLHILSSPLDNTGQSLAPPLIVTIRSRAHNPASYQMAQTIIDRWEVVSEPRANLHPAFEQLGFGSHGGPADGSLCTRLKKLDPVIINRVVVGFQAIPCQSGKALVLVMSDGTVEYRDRFTFEEIYHPSEGPEKVYNLRQVGWMFSDEGPCQQIALSPTQNSMIQLGDDGKVRWSRLHYPLGDIGNSHKDVQYGASIVALAATGAAAIMNSANYDDMLAIVHPYASKKRFTQEWVNEILKILKIQVDYSEELHHESLMRNAPLQSCLSIMNSLGFRGEFEPRSFQSKLAMIEVNVRNVVILITLASNTPVAGRETISPLDDHEVVDALAGCGKWSVDLLSWLLDNLFGLMNDDEFMAKLVPARFAEMTAYLQEQNNVALHLMLSSCGRSFLLALCRRISHLQATSGRATDYYQRQSASGNSPKSTSSQLHRAYQRMQTITASSLVKVHEFEKLLSALGQDIRTAYSSCLTALTKNGPNAPQGKQMEAAVKGRQIHFEVGMLMAAAPPPFFLPVVKKLFHTYLTTFRGHVDPTSLFFADYETLGIQDDRSSLAAREAKGIYVDLFRRAVLKKGSQVQWRRCTRCASVMEDVSGARPGPGFTFVLSQQRKCSCGGFWALLPRGKFIL